MTRDPNKHFDWVINHPPIGDSIAKELRDTGCPEAVISDESYHRHWTAIHDWCEEHFGNRYSWCGNAFFFTNHDDRLLFALRWS